MNALPIARSGLSRTAKHSVWYRSKRTLNITSTPDNASTRRSVQTNAATTTTTTTTPPPPPQFQKQPSIMTQVYTKEGEGVAPNGPFTPAIKANGFVFVSGQIPAHCDGILVEGTVMDKTHKMCQNTAAVLEAAGSSLEKVVKVTVYYQDIGQMSKMNEVYAEYFPQRPARSSVEARKLPGGASMEMDVIAME